MNIQENVDLSQYSTMRLGGVAKHLVVLHSKEDLVEAINWAKTQNEQFRMIGAGSNAISKSEGFDGLIAVNELKGIEKVAVGDSPIFKFASGEVWDDVVAYSVERNLSGIEALSLIPGTVGAAPVQNIGAYGQQLSDVFVELEAYNLETNEFITMTAEDCQFGYRTSVFKDAEKQRYIIVSVSLRLSSTSTIKKPLYKDIEKYLQDNKIADTSPSSIRQAVMAVRVKKLPDPADVASNGSFFANPIISKEEFANLAQAHPAINQAPKGWPQPPRWFVDDDKVKISAGWLVEQAGFGDYHDPDTGMATWHNQSLVLVNESAKSPTDLFTFRDKIVNAVREKFGIELKQEVEII